MIPPMIRLLVQLMAAALIIALPVACSAEPDQAEEAALVRTAWDEFRASLLAGDGATAASRVSKGTFAYYDQLLERALYADRAELEVIGLGDRFTVLLTRHRVSGADLKQLDGRGLFALGVDEGWISQSSVSEAGIGEIEVRGDEARAMVLRDGEPMGEHLPFVREDGRWRFDMTVVLVVLNDMFDSMRAEAGFTEEQFIPMLIQGTTGEPVSEELWAPRAE